MIMTPEQVRDKVYKNDIQSRQKKIDSLLGTLTHEDRIPGKVTHKKRKVDLAVAKISKEIKSIETALNKRLQDLYAKQKRGN